MEQQCRDGSLSPTASAATVYDAKKITVGLHVAQLRSWKSNQKFIVRISIWHF